MRKYLLVAFLIISFTSVFAFWPVAIFMDNFNDNCNEWEQKKTGKSSAFIKDGKYVMSFNDINNTYFVTRRVATENGRFYQIKASVNKNSNSGNYGFGLVFGYKDINNNYRLMVFNTGRYLVQKVENGTKTVILEKITNTFSNDAKIFNFKIEKYRDILKFYVNDFEIGSKSNILFFDDFYGFCITGSCEIAIDDFSITSDRPDNWRMFGNFNIKKKILSDSFDDNSNMWPIGKTGAADINISGGALNIVNNANKGMLAIGKSFQLHPDSSFVFSASIKKTSGYVQNVYYGLAWGYKDSLNFSVFVTNGYGNYSIISMKDGVGKNIIDWEESIGLNQGCAENDMTLVYKPKETMFFFNKYKAYSMPSVPFPVNSDVKFFVYGNASLIIDKTNIYYI